MVAKKKRTKIDFYQSDLPILATLAREAETTDQAEAIHFAFRLLCHMTDRIKELEDYQKNYVKDKGECWKQGRLRSELPFYG